MPNIGYGSNKKTKYLLPNGLRTFVVSSKSELSALLMHSEKFSATIASKVGARKKLDLLAHANRLGIKVANAKSKISTSE